MKEVLFTHSYFYQFDPKQHGMGQPYPPLATLQAASVIRNAGFHTTLFDTNLRNEAAEIIPKLKETKPDYVVIYDDGFNYLTKMCLTNMREAAFQIIEFSKSEGCCVIVSSSDSTDRYDDYLNQGADFIVRGEGEETLHELLLALGSDSAVNTISGLAYRQDGETILTGSRSVLRNLDSLPLPAWDLIDVESYKKIWQQKHGYFSLNLATTRGCPFKCNWCAKPIYGNRYNSRSPEHVISEIEFLIENFAPDHFWMCDDIFGLKLGWVEEFNALTKKKGLRFRYKIQSRVDLLLQENTVDALVQSGAETIWVGAESGSQKILDAMDKGTTVHQIHQATELLKRKGVRVGFFLQFGYVGESREDIDATLKMVLDLMPHEVGISVAYPLPGTKFYDQVKGQLKDKQNWRDSDDLAMLFQGAFSNAYYRTLQRYVHNRFRIKRGILALRNILKTPAYSHLRSIVSMLIHLPISAIQHVQLKYQA